MNNKKPTFEDVIQEFGGYIWTIVNNSGIKTEDLRKDVHQEIMLALHVKLPDYDINKSSLKTYVSNIAKYTRRDYMKKHYKLQGIEIPEHEEVEDEREKSSDEEFKEYLKGEGLTEQEISIILLLSQGYSQKEASEILESSTSAVSRRVINLKERYRNRLPETE